MKKIAFLIGSICISLMAHAQQPAYKNKNLSPDIRAKDLLNAIETRTIRIWRFYDYGG